ncbi:MAG: hypothetical protein JST12_01575 [Armatimonadetes bacterium]|nr:hypothetical protein [Armatimonadota bacterium]MBS1727766.1 hypothetical protein [Armatimonadota bacterium]
MQRSKHSQAIKLDYLWRLQQPLEGGQFMHSGTVEKLERIDDLSKAPFVLVFLAFTGYEDCLRALNKIHRLYPQIEPSLYTIDAFESYRVVFQIRADSETETLTFPGAQVHLTYWLKAFPSIHFFKLEEAGSILSEWIRAYDNQTVILWDDVVAIRIKGRERRAFWALTTSFYPTK